MNRPCVFCVHCGDPAKFQPGHCPEGWSAQELALWVDLCQGEKVLVDKKGRPSCYDCWRELVAGEIPKLTSSSGSNRAVSRIREDCSPADENATRIREGD